jgi:hypothetical protein
MSGSNHSAQGVPCISRERLGAGFAPTQNSNLRQAPASRDIPCLMTNLALLLAWDDVMMKQLLASTTGTSVFIFLLLSFFESLIIGLAPPCPSVLLTTLLLWSTNERASVQYWVTDTDTHAGETRQ